MVKTDAALDAHFFQLLRVAVGTSQEMPQGLTAEEWARLLDLAVKQSVAGLLFDQIERVDKDQLGIPLDVMFEWIGIAEQIKGQNSEQNTKCVEVCRYFEKRGFRCCILKGQGNALLYPDPYGRTPGDIDLWLMPRQEGKTRRDDRLAVIRMARRLNPKGKVCYHHADAGKYKGEEVEIHYRPSFMNSLINNRRLQQWFDARRQKQFCHRVELPENIGTINVPDMTFNLVFQMAHISNHVMHEGLGLRQIVDYCFLLQKARLEQGDGDWAMLAPTLQQLGLLTMARAVMFVMQEVFGMDSKTLPVAPDERRGRFLLDEMMAGGNFGRYDERVSRPATQWQANLLRLRRDMRLLRYFPSESLWEPVFRWYHFFWRFSYERFGNIK